MSTNGGAAAVSFIDALKGQPLSLALVVMNLGLLGYLYYEGIQNHNDRQKEQDLLYENRKYVTDALAKCVPPEVLQQLNPLTPTP